MTDEFQFGERAKHPARLSGPRPPRPTSSFPFKLVGVVACLVVAAAAAFVFLRGADEAGKEIADAQSETLAQVDRAYDAAAQGTVGRAVVVAQTLYAEQGTFTTDLPTLSAFDPVSGSLPARPRAPRRSPTRSAGWSSRPRSDRNRVPAGG